MAELVWNWDMAPGEAMAKPGLIPAERQGSGCKSQALPGTSPRAFAPSSSGAPGMRRGRERGSLQPGATGGAQPARALPASPGSAAAGQWGWVRAQLGSAMSGGLCRAWARPRFVYSFSLLFCLTIYSWLPFSHGGCIYLARRAWSLPGSRAAAEQGCNPGVEVSLSAWWGVCDVHRSETMF